MQQNTVTLLPVILPEKPLSVVFLHHFGGSAKTWSEAIRRLAAIEPTLRCLTPDLRGFGGTVFQSDSGRDYSIEDYADEIAALMIAGGFKRYLLVGHSMGGKIALALAARQPPGLVGLLLVAPSPPTPEPMTDDARAQLRKARDSAAVASEIVSMASATHLPEAIRQRTIADILRSAPGAWNAWLDDGSRRDISESVSQIDVPVMVLAAGHDTAMTPDLLRREIIDRIPGSRLAVVPDSGHLMPLDAPAAICAYVRDFAKSLNAAASSEPMTDGPAHQSSWPHRVEYPTGTVRALLNSDLVTEPTRRALQSRLDTTFERGVYFDRETFDTLRAVCDRLVPQAHQQEKVDIAGAIGSRLAAFEGNGWRYEVLPRDGEAYRIGLRGLNEAANETYGVPFCGLTPAEQDHLLFCVQHDRVDGGLWTSFAPGRFFEELLAEASEIYFSSVCAQERIGYVGMADNQGWDPISLNQLMPHEPRAVEASNV